jgi:hypothetical protein
LNNPNIAKRRSVVANETSLRRFYFFLMVGAFLLAAVSTAMLFFPLFDVTTQLGFGVMATVCWLVAIFSFRTWRRTSSHVLVGDCPINATPQQLFRYYLIIMCIVILAFSALSIWVICDLNRLESHEVQSVTVWAPIAALYNAFGYWPAVLATPIFGVFIFGAGLAKMRDSMAKQQANANRDIGKSPWTRQGLRGGNGNMNSPNELKDDWDN